MLPDPLAMVRAVHFAACLVALGTAGFATLIAVTDRALDRHFRQLAAAALAVAALSGAAWFLLVAAKILDTPLTDVLGDSGLASVVTDTRFGRIAILRLALAVLAAAALPSPRGRWPGLAALAALTAAIAGTGHAGAGTGPAGAVQLASDVAHLLGAGLWLGALPAFAGLLLWSRNDPDRRALATQVTRRFSRLAIACVAVLTISGLINSAVLVGWPSDLLASTYGRVLAQKLALFAAILGLAAINRYRLTPRLPDGAALRQLIRTTWIETGLGAGIMVLVGVLGLLVPASHLLTQTATAIPGAAFVHLHTEVVMADVSIDPGAAGTSTATIRLSHDDYTPFTANGVQLALDPSFAGPARTQGKARLLTDGSWLIADLHLQTHGVWTIHLRIDHDGTSTVINAPVLITQCSNDCR